MDKVFQASSIVRGMVGMIIIVSSRISGTGTLLQLSSTFSCMGRSRVVAWSITTNGHGKAIPTYGVARVISQGRGTSRGGSGIFATPIPLARVVSRGRGGIILPICITSASLERFGGGSVSHRTPLIRVTVGVFVGDVFPQIISRLAIVRRTTNRSQGGIDRIIAKT